MKSETICETFEKFTELEILEFVNFHNFCFIKKIFHFQLSVMKI